MISLNGATTGDPEIDKLDRRDKLLIFVEELIKEYPNIYKIDLEHEAENFNFQTIHGNNLYLPPKSTSLTLSIRLNN